MRTADHAGQSVKMTTMAITLTTVVAQTAGSWMTSMTGTLPTMEK